eukprot:1146999-Pelagomonas_calceolata.AAC.8
MRFEVCGWRRGWPSWVAFVDGGEQLLKVRFALVYMLSCSCPREDAPKSQQAAAQGEHSNGELKASNVCPCEQLTTTTWASIPKACRMHLVAWEHISFTSPASEWHETTCQNLAPALSLQNNVLAHKVCGIRDLAEKMSECCSPQPEGLAQNQALSNATGTQLYTKRIDTINFSNKCEYKDMCMRARTHIFEHTHTQVTTEEQRTNFVDALSAAEDWLYDEGDAEVAKVFREKLASLRLIGEPMRLRALVGGLHDRPVLVARMIRILARSDLSPS